ncbi:UAP56-interacting factor-like [Notechis scutatus]|uniref:UAP56-interacting factor n=1 Tax=Notechis scutatus TaxID=8663 RepID=A0A6J1VWE9_9SAUR|nr:UAP56-interacting factor-like [Notechis scutatus]
MATRAAAAAAMSGFGAGASSLQRGGGGSSSSSGGETLEKIDMSLVSFPPQVQAQVHPEGDYGNQGNKRTRPWRTSTRTGGILTISIDNPGAVLSPISLKPRLTSNLIPPFLLKKEPSEEKKVPKGVPLQFDINSVGKQTSMTLNERFGILKEQRTALAQNKGSRFVTVA